MWQEAQTPGQQPEAEAGHDPQQAWRKHFADFLGVEPEAHWLFGGRRFKTWASGEWGPPGLLNPFIAMLLSKGGGLLSLYVLFLLSERPRYGNDIMRVIEERTDGRWGANPGAVYPMLGEMEEAGFVEGEWADPEKRTRRMYRLTHQGQDELDRLKEVMRPKLAEAISILQELFQDLERQEINPMETIISEFRVIETDDGFRIEIKGDKEKLRPFFTGAGGPGPFHFGHRGGWRGPWGMPGFPPDFWKWMESWWSSGGFKPDAEEKGDEQKPV